MPLKPGLSAASHRCRVEMEVSVPPEIVYRAWTEDFDRWFAADGTLLMKPRIDVPFFFETHFDGGRHPHYGRFLQLVPNELVELTWVTGDPGTGGAETVINIQISPQGSGSKVELTHAGFADKKTCEGHADAWPLAFEHLDKCMQDSV